MTPSMQPGGGGCGVRSTPQTAPGTSRAILEAWGRRGRRASALTGNTLSACRSPGAAGGRSGSRDAVRAASLQGSPWLVRTPRGVRLPEESRVWACGYRSASVTEMHVRAAGERARPNADSGLVSLGGGNGRC